MKKGLIFLIVVFVFLVSSCKENKNEIINDNTLIENNDKEDDNLKLLLSVDGKDIPVTWENNESFEELKEISRNGLEIVLNQFGGFEQTGQIGKTIVSNDVQMDVSCGDIVLYNSRQICLYYSDNSWSFTRLGKINLPKDEIIKLLNKDSVKIILNVK